MALTARIASFGKGEEARLVLDRVNAAREVMRDMHEDWFYYIAFARGYQWAYRDRELGGVGQVPVTPWKARITDNQTRPLTTQMLALLIQNRPTWRATARTGEEQDVLAATGYQALLTYDWDRLDLSDLLEMALLDMLWTGNGFWRIAWNPKAGSPVLVPVQEGTDTMAAKDAPAPESKGGLAGQEPEEQEEPEALGAGMFARMFGEPPEAAPAAAPSAFEEVVYEGDVDVQHVSPFDIYVAPNATSMRNAPWVAQQAFISRDVLVDRIGSRAKNLPSDVTAAESTDYSQRLRVDAVGAAIGLGESEDLIRVLEFWEAPSGRHKSGRVITVAGNETLAVKENPSGGRYPFIHFACLPVPGRFWADGIVREIEPLQVAHNRSLGRYFDIMVLSSNPKVIADSDAGLKETNINTEPGEVIFKKRGSQVVFAPAPVPPTIHPQIMAITANSMQFVTGISDPLAGSAPANVRTAGALRDLQTASRLRFIPIVQRVAGSLRRAARLQLYLHQRYTTAARTVRILGASSRPQVYHMTRADVGRVVDVTVDMDSLLPQAPGAKQEAILSLLQYAPQLFMDDDGRFDSEAVLTRLEMPTTGPGLGLREAQRMRAYQEHVALQEGRPITVLPFDDDALHLRIHAARLCSDEWATKFPEAAGQLNEHYADHQISIQRKAMMMMVDPNAQGMAGPPQQSSGAEFPQAAAQGVRSQGQQPASGMASSGEAP